MLYAWGSILQAGLAVLSTVIPCSCEHAQHRKDKSGGGSLYARRLVKLKAMIQNTISPSEYHIATAMLTPFL